MVSGVTKVATCASMRRPHLPHLRQPPALTVIETQSLPGDARLKNPVLLA